MFHYELNISDYFEVFSFFFRFFLRGVGGGEREGGRGRGGEGGGKVINYWYCFKTLTSHNPNLSGISSVVARFFKQDNFLRFAFSVSPVIFISMS